MNLNFMSGRFSGVIMLALLACLVFFIYVFGSALDMGVIALIVGAFAGVLSIFGLYNYFNQEKKLYFPEQEKVLLTSSGNSSYVVFVSIGEQDFPLNPIRSDIYLTNIGVLAEPPSSGESILYIPHYRITELVPYRDNGITLRYFDVNDQFAEVILYLQDRNQWVDRHLKLLTR
ncbi:MAG: hypothetical protein ABIH11_00900 [Candidatus Altiarchaeota archaeon]